MNWYIKHLAQVTVRPFTEDADVDDDYPGDYHQDWSNAENAFRESKIRPASNKNLTQIADYNGQAIGGVYSSWNVNKSDNLATFDFDVAVSPKYRGNMLAGIKLIEAALEQYESEKSMYAEEGYNTMILVQVVNPRLVAILEKRFGFEVETSYGPNKTYMRRY